jgi:hypothetical protein
MRKRSVLYYYDARISLADGKMGGKVGQLPGQQTSFARFIALRL